VETLGLRRRDRGLKWENCTSKDFVTVELEDKWAHRGLEGEGLWGLIIFVESYLGGDWIPSESKKLLLGWVRFGQVWLGQKKLLRL